MRVLVVEDQADIKDLVQESLELSGFLVKSTINGRTGLELALGEPWHAIVLDALLPGVDGWEICRQLRAAKMTCPILMLTARDAIEDRVRGLELGADDYLTKPFDVKELVARVHALTRRGHVHKSRFIKIGDLEIDTLAQRVSRAGNVIQLTKREYSLLIGLAAREGQVLTREVIQDRIWMDEYAVSNTVEAYIKLLRKKIDSGFDEKLIHTVHGFGYCLERRLSP
jgi:DNA-binding response OmpR family regulator